MLDRRIRIINQLGLHARAAGKLVRLVDLFRASVILRCNGNEVNAGSILDVLAMAAAYGTIIEIVVNGPDEEEAMSRIEELFLDGFGEL